MADDTTANELQQASMLELNAPAPDFEATTTHGRLRLSEWGKEKWVILFSHPADFTPVCTTEFMEFARLQEEFDKRNVLLIGNSIDSVYSHIAWIRSIKQHVGIDIRYPVIADLDLGVSKLYRMVHEAAAVAPAPPHGTPGVASPRTRRLTRLAAGSPGAEPSGQLRPGAVVQRCETFCPVRP